MLQVFFLFVVWDSMQFPAGQLFGSRYHLGNYDQCLREKDGAPRAPFSMQYCLADILLQPNTEVSIPTEGVDRYDSADAYIGVSANTFVLIREVEL